MRDLITSLNKTADLADYRASVSPDQMQRTRLSALADVLRGQANSLRREVLTTTREELASCNG